MQTAPNQKQPSNSRVSSTWSTNRCKPRRILGIYTTYEDQQSHTHLAVLRLGMREYKLVVRVILRPSRLQLLLPVNLGTTTHSIAEKLPSEIYCYLTSTPPQVGPVRSKEEVDLSYPLASTLSFAEAAVVQRMQRMGAGSGGSS